VAKFKIKKNDLKKLVGQTRKRLIARSFRSLSKVLKNQIINESILKGKSPVQGQGRFARYSESYKKQIKSGKYRGKSVSPVNLKLKGKLLKSFKINKIGNGFSLFFKDKKSVFHQSGTPKMPKRQLLPEPDETFNRRITRAYNLELVKAIKKVLPKNKIKRRF